MQAAWVEFIFLLGVWILALHLELLGDWWSLLSMWGHTCAMPSSSASALKSDYFCIKVWLILYFINIIFQFYLTQYTFIILNQKSLASHNLYLIKIFLISVISRIINGSIRSSRYIMHCIPSIASSKSQQTEKWNNITKPEAKLCIISICMIQVGKSSNLSQQNPQLRDAPLVVQSYRKLFWLD